MMREAKIDTIVQVLTVPVHLYRYLLYLLYRYLLYRYRWITSSKLQTSRSRRQNLRNTRLVSREFHLCQSQDSER